MSDGLGRSITLRLVVRETDVLNRGIEDVLRSIHLGADGSVVQDYEGLGNGMWSGTTIGEWSTSEA